MKLPKVLIIVELSFIILLTNQQSIEVNESKKNCPNLKTSYLKFVTVSETCAGVINELKLKTKHGFKINGPLKITMITHLGFCSDQLPQELTNFLQLKHNVRDIILILNEDKSLKALPRCPYSEMTVGQKFTFDPMELMKISGAYVDGPSETTSGHFYLFQDIVSTGENITIGIKNIKFIVPRQQFGLILIESLLKRAKSPNNSALNKNQSDEYDFIPMHVYFVGAFFTIPVFFLVVIDLQKYFMAYIKRNQVRYS